MKIAVANNFYYIRGGAERVLFDETALLTERGHEIIPFARKHPMNLPTAWSRFFPCEIDYDNVSFYQQIKAAGKLIYSWEAKKRFGRLLSACRPDIVHAHNIYGRLTTSILDEARKKGVPVVMTAHDYKLVCPSYLMLCRLSICEACKGGKFYSALLRRCHRDSFFPSLVYCLETYLNRLLEKYEKAIRFIICPSCFSVEKHAQMGFPQNKLVNIPNFVNAERLVPEFKPGNYVLYVGRISKEKGILTLLSAMRGLNIDLKLVGDGPLRSQCEKFVAKNGMDRVSFEGYRSNESLLDLYRNSSFVVCPSEWYENAPMVILESFALGKPVVGSRIGGIPEMITDHATGMIFEPGEAEALRYCIKYLWEQPRVVSEMGRNARLKVENYYTPERHYDLLMKIYSRAMS